MAHISSGFETPNHMRGLPCFRRGLRATSRLSRMLRHLGDGRERLGMDPRYDKGFRGLGFEGLGFRV